MMLTHSNAPETEAMSAMMSPRLVPPEAVETALIGGTTAARPPPRTTRREAPTPRVMPAAMFCDAAREEAMAALTQTRVVVSREVPVSVRDPL